MGFETLQRSVPRVGILGASRIVQSALLNEAPGLVEIVAVAARDLERAQAFADERRIPRAYGSYAELVADPEIDVVYNALPASGHAPWSREALLADKHVLCEKPFGLHSEEARELVELAEKRQRLLMEAHHWRYHPLIREVERALSELRDGAGPFVIEASFVGGLNNPGDIRLNPLLGPGALMDFGCYTIQWCHFFADVLSGGKARPVIVQSEIVEGDPGIDLAAEVQMGFENAGREIEGSFTCDFRDQTPFRAFVRVSAGDRVVHFENPLGFGGAYLEETVGRETRRTEPGGGTTYGGQLGALLEALRSGNSPHTSGERIIVTQQLLDDCYTKAGSITRRQLRKETLARGITG